MPSALVVLACALVGVWAMAPAAPAQSSRMVRIEVRFQHSAVESADGVQGHGGVIVTERGGVRPRGRISAGRADTRSRRSAAIFTLVQDGGESTLTVAAQVPSPQVAFCRDYATGAGHLARGVVFREVGTSLKVRASLLPADQVRVRITPSISWLSADGSGTIEFTEAATEVVVASGRPLVIAGADTHTHVVTREILGVAAREGSTASTVILTATAQ